VWRPPRKRRRGVSRVRCLSVAGHEQVRAVGSGGLSPDRVVHVIERELAGSLLPHSARLRRGFAPEFVRDGMLPQRRSSRCAWMSCATFKAWPSLVLDDSTGVDERQLVKAGVLQARAIGAQLDAAIRVLEDVDVAMDQLPAPGKVRQQVAHAVMLQGERQRHLAGNAPGEDQIQVLIVANRAMRTKLHPLDRSHAVAAGAWVSGIVASDTGWTYSSRIDGDAGARYEPGSHSLRQP